MVGFCHLTDSHHYHHGQKPTMVGIYHCGKMPVGHDNFDDDDPGGDDKHGCDSAAAIKCKLSDRALFCLS